MSLAGVDPGTLSVCQVVSFGWEITDLHNNGADVAFPVEVDMLLLSLEVDVATMLTSLPAAAGFLEVLCTAAVGRGAPPTFGPPPQAYLDETGSPNFSAIATDNPSGLQVGVGPTTPGRDGLFGVILKAWAPADGTASSASRHVRTPLRLPLAKGDFLGFHMDHAGVGVDGEMQVVLGYQALG